ncbi:spore photoproduct lyase family protein [Deltaproteobacteria bacterium TL4]
MFEYQPERIIIDDAVKKEPLTLQVCERFSQVPQEVVSDYAWHRHEVDEDPLKNPLTRGKKILHLKYFQGVPIKLCPGLTEGVLCCNYYTINFVENCPFECTYCILQAFLNKPVITVHANVDEILQQVGTLLASRAPQWLRVGTGEHSDSLALDPILGISAHLIRFFAEQPNGILELKTKSAHVDHLLDLPHQGKTVIAWSLNPETVVEQEEFKTAGLDERLCAAKKAAEAGYKLAFHFDPVIHYPTWEKEYHLLIEKLFEVISAEQVVWISIGTLRYIPKLKSIVEERFPNNRLFLGEFIPGDGKKMRYYKKIRQTMIYSITQKLKQKAPGVPVYLCMESQNVWQKTMPRTPQNNGELENWVCQKFSHAPSFPN